MALGYLYRRKRALRDAERHEADFWKLYDYRGYDGIKEVQDVIHERMMRAYRRERRLFGCFLAAQDRYGKEVKLN